MTLLSHLCKELLKYHHSEILYEVEGLVSKTEFGIHDIQTAIYVQSENSVQKQNL